MKFAITGASSLIGKKVMNLLTDSGHDVFCLVREPRNSREIKFDLSLSFDSKLLRTFDLLIHIGWDKSRDFQHSLKINRDGGRDLLDACKKNGVLPVLLSTMSVHSQSSGYGGIKLALEEQTLELSGRVIRAGLIWGAELSGFLETLYRLSNLPLIQPILHPDPKFFHSEINSLAEAIVSASLSRRSQPIISATSRQTIFLSELMFAMRKSYGLRFNLSSKTVYKLSKRSEHLGLKLPFNSDSISGILETLNFDNVSETFQRETEFPNSKMFLSWASNL